ncbi:MAG TPA: plastocyanin/azurin family copper-binding protein [Syntrophales bacterium]|nr:plastocyanin/azurin family copper-binding protein [Syntrophales bacterium]HOX93327.1 plastocyanin/azurin family copper-binding protein [Syntrophales bacterium]HPI56528.1 plastocyanin/azurin family copper-binding protein [Syntrophales bacterium]HPN25051.1 plastocyanin/azurin family copper-binding protein [Syntrophales bacterium]HQM29206.1 plastocyanin/azurin family copper-binding protein [Syntrophales bacterium]
MDPGSHFEVTLTVEGVYDYFCIPHEMAGMVGRIIVGRPTGPGSLPFDYYRGRPGTADWQPVPEATQRAFPGIERIMRERVIRR